MKHIGKQWLCLVLAIFIVLVTGGLPVLAEEKTLEEQPLLRSDGF